MTLSRGVVAMCAAQACAQLGAFSVAVVLPTLISVWALTNTEAGWISGIYYAAYTVAVPLLSSLTDRIDQAHLSRLRCPDRRRVRRVRMDRKRLLVGPGVPGAD